MTIKQFEFDDRMPMDFMTTSKFLDRTYQLYVFKYTQPPAAFEEELKHFFRDILNK